MGLIFSDPPPAPNPVLTAGLQTASNINTAVGSAYLSNVNQETPQGNLTYKNAQPYSWTDPTGVTWNVPTFTAQQTRPDWVYNQGTYGPSAGWSLDAAEKATQFNLGITGLGRSWDLMNMGAFDPNAGAPGAAPMDWLHGVPMAQTSFDDAGPIQRGITDPGQQQTSFGDAGAITRDYGPADNFSADRARVEQALFQRMDPQLQQDRQRLRQQLADQGIQYGTKAYDDAIAAADRQTTDARLAVTAAGGAEQQRMNDMAAQRAGFQNAAQKQAYDQALGRGTFANQAQLEQFQKNLQSGNFANQAQKDAFTQNASRAQFFNTGTAQNLARNKTIFDAQNASRASKLAENYQARAQPINEISALQSGAQLQQPNFVDTNRQQIANTDVAGIINANFGQQLDIYKQQNANVNNIIGGLFGLAGSGAKAYAASDRRVKKRIHKLGTVFAGDKYDDPKKLPIYAYAYKDDPSGAEHIGPMAQDVEKIDPDAVAKDRRGVRYVDHKRVMGDILRVA